MNQAQANELRLSDASHMVLGQQLQDKKKGCRLYTSDAADEEECGNFSYLSSVKQKNFETQSSPILA